MAASDRSRFRSLAGNRAARRLRRAGSAHRSVNEHRNHLESVEPSISFDVKLAGDGTVDSLALRDSTLGDEELELCMASALRSLSEDDLPLRQPESSLRRPVAPESRALEGHPEVLAACLVSPPCLLTLVVLAGATYITVALYVDATNTHAPAKAKPHPESWGEPRKTGPSIPADPPEPKDERETCEEKRPDIIRCDDPRIRYRLWSENDAFYEIVNSLGKKGKGVRKANRARAREGPCVGRGGFHINVLSGGDSVGSIVGCRCCDDSSGKAADKVRADAIVKQ